MQLAIPRGWAVVDNKFFDTDPVTRKGSSVIENASEGFTMDVLWIFEIRMENNHLVVPETNHYSISLGWSPDSRVPGNYHAELNWFGVKGVIRVDDLVSSDRYEVRDRIDKWMYDIRMNYKEAHEKYL